MFPKYWARVVIVLTLAGSAVTDLQNPVGHELSAGRVRITNRRCKGVGDHKVKFFTRSRMLSTRNKPTLATTERSEVTARVEDRMPVLEGKTILPVTPGFLVPFVTSIHDLPEEPHASRDLQRAPQNKIPTWSGRIGLARIAFPGRSPPMMPFPDQNDILLLKSTI